MPVIRILQYRDERDGFKAGIYPVELNTVVDGLHSIVVTGRVCVTVDGKSVYNSIIKRKSG